MFEQAELEFLRQLIKHKVSFMIVGLSAAALQGAPVVTQDIDLWFREISSPELRKALKAVDGVYVPCFGFNPPGFAGKSVALFDLVTNMSGLEDFSNEEKNIIQISLGDLKVPVLKLERIIKSKRAANREKDRLVLKVLEDALAAIQEMEKKVRS